MAKENDFSLNAKKISDVVKEFVIPNCFLQVNDAVNEKGGVAIPYIVSKPGAGKTEIIKKTANDLGWGFMSLHIALKPTEELTGIPEIVKINVNGKEIPGTVWTVTDIVSTLHQMYAERKTIEFKNQQIVTENNKKYLVDNNKKIEVLGEFEENGAKYFTLNENKYPVIILLYDDAHLCGPSHMALFYEPLTERSIRGHKFPPNVAQILAGNDSNKAGAKSFFSAITNRCARLPVIADYDQWRDNFAIPMQTHGAVIAFCGNSLYSKFFHEEELQDTPWGSPRSWARLANYIQVQEKWYKKSIDPSNLQYYACAHVGSKAGSEFTSFYEVFSKFPLEKILNSSETFDIKNNEYVKGDVDAYALAFALLSYYCGSEEIYTKKYKNFAQISVSYLRQMSEVAFVVLKNLQSYSASIDKKGNKVFMNVLHEIKKIDETLTTNLLNQAGSL
jgi:hypothetical protein